MIRVAMITDHSDHGDKADGGVQAVTRYLISGLIERKDIDLHVIGFKYGISERKTVSCDGYLRHVLPGSRFGAITGYWQDQANLNKLLAEISPDIVHGQGIGQNGIVAARSRYPTVLTIHGVMAEEANFRSGLINKSRHRLMNLWSEIYCVRKARFTIQISPYVADYYRGRLTGQLYQIANPVGETFFSVERRPDKGRILFAGRLRYLKGVSDLVEAVAILAKSHDVQLFLAGSLDDKKYVEQLRQRARHLGIEKRVNFLGLLSESGLQSELSRCTMLVLPSYQETAPMVIAEAMAVGVPVIATDVGGVRYLVRDGESGFIVGPQDIGSLANRMSQLLSSDVTPAAFGRFARLLAGTEYRVRQVAEKTVRVYQEALTGVVDELDTRANRTA